MASLVGKLCRAVWRPCRMVGRFFQNNAMTLRQVAQLSMLIYQLLCLKVRWQFSSSRVTSKRLAIKPCWRNTRRWQGSEEEMPISHESRFPLCEFCGKPELPPGIVIIYYSTTTE